MGRYDEPSYVTGPRGVTLQHAPLGPPAVVHVRRHVRTIPDAPLGTEWLQTVALGHRPRHGTRVAELVGRIAADPVFGAVRLPARPDVDGVVSSLAASPDLPPGLGTPISVFRMGDEKRDPATSPRAGTQAVARAIDILDAIAERPMMLAELAERVGLAPPTCYRIAKAMAERGLLATSGRNGFALGPKAAELGVAYRKQSEAGTKA